MLELGALAANDRERLALGRLEQRASVRINESGDLHFGKIDARVDRPAARCDLCDLAAGDFGKQRKDGRVELSFRQRL